MGQVWERMIVRRLRDLDSMEQCRRLAQFCKVISQASRYRRGNHENLAKSDAYRAPKGFFPFKQFFHMVFLGLPSPYQEIERHPRRPVCVGHSGLKI
jgi:hypothetical protein